MPVEDQADDGQPHDTGEGSDDGTCQVEVLGKATHSDVPKVARIRGACNFLTWRYHAISHACAFQSPFLVSNHDGDITTLGKFRRTQLLRFRQFIEGVVLFFAPVGVPCRTVSFPV